MDFLKDHPTTFVLDPYFQRADYFPLDLSVDNADLQKIDVSSPSEIQEYIDKRCHTTGKKIAYGGYLEKRGIYQRSNHFMKTDPSRERNIHLGIDLWCPSGTQVHASLAGHLHSFQNNTKFGDYGPTIILEHEINGTQFYSLYGHLSLESLATLQLGQAFNQGETIATVGSTEVNGNYAPHLHFQLILDLQGYAGDYPGVSNAHDLSFYTANCPNPNLLLKIDEQ